MGFLTAVERLSLRARPMPEQGTTARLARSLPPVAPIERPHVDLDSVAGNFIACIRRGTQPSLRDWNRIAWCLWTTKPAVAEDDRALDAMLNRVVDMVRNKKRRPYRQLASAYLTDFAIDRPKLAQISGVLRDFASAAGEPWDKLQARYALFTGAEAVGRIARLALREQTNIQGLLKPAGVRGMLLEAGFAEAVHDKGLEILRSTPVHTAVERIDTVRRWSLDEERLIFKRCKGQLARAVVLPFGERIPALAERNEILNFLIARFGDPRISGGEWIGLDDVVDILRRWLIEQSLRQFLDVVDKIAPDHMWKYRRAFWQAYHEKELLQNAWVIFGDEGAVEARRAFGKDVPFGRFRSGGRRQIEPGHAVLLLDFGECIVADWSHNGRCNIWKKSDRNCPKLNAPYYTTDEIMRPLPKNDRTEPNLNKNDMFTHVGADTYIWQNRVAERLYQLIGVRVQPSDYRAP